MQNVHASLDPFHQQGWNQPPQGGAVALPLAPMAAPPVPAPGRAPVTGGGGTSTATRLRWGRLGLVVAGFAIVGIAIWSAAPAAPSKSTASGARDAGGALAPLSTAAEEADANTANADTGAAADANESGAATIDMATNEADAAAATSVPGVADTTTTAPAAAAASATTAPAVGGGGPAASAPATTEELPYTGAETWIAAMLGVLVLGLGICIQINAVRIGMTAMLYRRGILLRPIDCARLANERGFGSLRVLLSNALHRLLAEPEGNDFVRVRHA